MANLSAYTSKIITAKKSFYLASGLLLVGVSFFKISSTSRYYGLSNHRRLLVWTSQDPYSTDPYQFDLGVHHVLDGPIYLRLFTAYKDAVLSGSAADSWSASDSDRHWEIRVRHDLKFSNGEKVTAVDVKNSIKRIFFLAMKSNSSLPLMKNVQGIENLKSLDTEISGLRVDGDRVIFDFKKSQTNLIELLAFGLYSIVHPGDYDAKTGKWLAVIPTSSGPYTLQGLELDKKFARMELRDDFPTDLYFESAPQKIEVTWDRSRRMDAQILDGFEGEAPPAPGQSFRGSTESDTIFFQCTSWNDPKSLFSARRNRILLRETFYRELIALGVRPVRSLYPLNLPGAIEAPEPTVRSVSSDFRGKEITIMPPRNLQVPAFMKIKEALIAAILRLGAVPKVAEAMSSQNYALETAWREKNAHRLDIATRSVSIGNEDPAETTRLMYSREGIDLPDPGSRIAKTILNNNFNISTINQAIYADALVWPILHFSNGFWASESVDLSRYNEHWPLSELQWMGFR